MKLIPHIVIVFLVLILTLLVNIRKTEGMMFGRFRIKFKSSRPNKPVIVEISKEQKLIEHIRKNLLSPTISILDTNILCSCTHEHHKQLCPLIHGNSSTMDEIKTTYLTYIFTIANYPNIYRENAELLITQEDVDMYRLRHCQVPPVPPDVPILVQIWYIYWNIIYLIIACVLNIIKICLFIAVLYCINKNLSTPR